MHLDEQALFSDQQAITTTAVSTNFVNLGAAATAPHAPAAISQDFGGGQDIPTLIQVTEDFAGGTSLKVDMQVDDNSSFSSPTIVASSPVFVTADLVAGKQLPIPVLPSGVDQQYVRLNYTVVGTMTAGKVTAGITAGNQTNG